MANQQDGPRETAAGLEQPGGKQPENARPGMTDTSQQLIDAEQPQDTLSARDHNTRHGKVTADKWNQ